MSVVWYGDRLAAAGKQAAIEIAWMDADIVKGQAVEKSPVEFGTNRGSANVDPIPNGAEISFNTPYSAWLHESQNYKPKEPGTGPGYLRQPLLEFEDQYLADVARAMKAIFG